MLVVRLIEGEFPNYERVIPQNNKNRVILNKRELLEALQRVTVMSDEETRAVKMVVKTGTLTISSKKIGLGDAKEEVGVRAPTMTSLKSVLTNRILLMELF